jgi:putative MATE family efflux protein
VPTLSHAGDRDLRAVVRLALPAIATSLLQTLVFLVDRLVLGHHSETSLAAMQTAGPIAWSVFSVFGAFTVGTVAVVGRAIGARDAAAASSAARGSLAIAVCLGLAVGLGSFALIDPILEAFGNAGGASVRDASRNYLAVTLPALPLYFIGLTAISIQQAAGDTRTPLAIGIVTNLVNAVLNWVLVFGHLGFHAMGTRGSAWASVVAASIETTLGCLVLLSSRSPVRLRVGPGVNAIDGARRVVRVSWGSWGELVIKHTGYLAFVGFVVSLGSAAMAANQALISIESIAFLTADGCAVAAGALVAQRLGANDPDGARRAGWLSAALCASLLGACGIVFFVVPGTLVSAFRDDPAIVAAGISALRVDAFAQIPMAVAVVLAQSMRGAGATREAMIVTFAGGLVVRLAVTWITVMKLHLGLMGVWIGSSVDWLARAIAYAIRWRADAWSRTHV